MVITTKRTKCWDTFTDTLTSKDLRVLLDVNVTAQLKRGGQVSTTVNLQKISEYGVSDDVNHRSTGPTQLQVQVQYCETDLDNQIEMCRGGTLGRSVKECRKSRG